jgi:bifunctional non-homologous end joining protein LigD
VIEPPLVPSTSPATRCTACASSHERAAAKGSSPTARQEPPKGDQWLNEIKLDGYRLLIWIADGKARIRTRNDQDWTDRLPAVAAEATKLGVQTALLDGELVAMWSDGTSSFPDLQAALSAGRDQVLFFYVFDLLHLDGWDLRPSHLIDRKAVLASLAKWEGQFRYSEHIQGTAAAVLRNACRMNLEGIICKRADAPYRPGRSRDWLKVKCQGREELVILGWTPPGGSRRGFGALHVGYYDPAGRLHYAGGVGTGYSERELATIRERLDALASDPPAGLLVAGDPLDPAIHWVRPELVAEVQFTAWSGAGRVRHPVFLGLREDKAAAEVVRDVADPEDKRVAVTPRRPSGGVGRWRPKMAVPPRRRW